MVKKLNVTQIEILKLFSRMTRDIQEERKHMYVPLGMGMVPIVSAFETRSRKWNAMQKLAKEGHVVKVSHYEYTLTEKGKILLEEWEKLNR